MGKEISHLSYSMDSAIGSAGPVERDGFSGNLFYRAGNGFLNANLPFLELPAAIVRAVVFDD